MFFRGQAVGRYTPRHRRLFAGQTNDSLLYINPGTDYWGIPFRIGTRPEVTVITLWRSGEGERSRIELVSSQGGYGNGLVDTRTAGSCVSFCVSKVLQSLASWGMKYDNGQHELAF